ncbi:hypothetical protein [Limnofasciculus baicalensis]|uniref:Uncharacterized protein n=1 Tax=Limnofasciculus baicalensis BBK-W-15 TaxID=2699891 RepID=A0AAE3GMF4_9CYAN|nr:hypothetical protein [Limnofasciculus baicalensis]MCP2727295.1 hypothetical protein [Limnofasciculus baicalensis BBK-W-15]
MFERFTEKAIEVMLLAQEDSKRRPRTMLDVANALKVIYQQETGEAYPRPEPEVGKDIADSLNNRAVANF